MPDMYESFSGESELRLELHINPVMENIDSNGTDDATLQDTVVPLDSMYTGYTDSFICQKWRISSSVVDTLLKIHQLYYIVPYIIILPIVLYCIYTFI